MSLSVCPVFWCQSRPNFLVSKLVFQCITYCLSARTSVLVTIQVCKANLLLGRRMTVSCSRCWYSSGDGESPAGCTNMGDAQDLPPLQPQHRVDQGTLQTISWDPLDCRWGLIVSDGHRLAWFVLIGFSLGKERMMMLDDVRLSLMCLGWLGWC